MDDDIMTAFADDDGYGGDDMEESETRLPNLSGLVLYRDQQQHQDDNDEPSLPPTKASTSIVAIDGALSRELIGDSEAEYNAACAIVSAILSDSMKGRGYKAVLDEAQGQSTKGLPKTVCVHTQMNSDKDGTFESMVASFAMASCGGGGVGVAVQFIESGYAVSLVGRGRGDYMLVDHHLRDPVTGGMPRGLGNGSAIAIHSNVFFPLSQYMVKTYGHVTPIRYRATFLIPAVPKGKEEEEDGYENHPTIPKHNYGYSEQYVKKVTEEVGKDEIRQSLAAYTKATEAVAGKVLPPRVTQVYDEDNDCMVSAKTADVIAAARVSLDGPEPMEISSPKQEHQQKNDDVMIGCVDQDEEEPSSEGKRKRAQTAAVTVRSESDESDEKRAKTPPAAAAAAQSKPVVTATAKKTDSVPTVVVKKATRQATTAAATASKPKSVATTESKPKAVAVPSSATGAATKGKE